MPDDPAYMVDSQDEKEVWQGAPSQWQNLGWWLACLLVVPIPFALWRWLVVRNQRYVLTDQRLKSSRGVFNRTTDDLELYRIKDTRFAQSVWQRMVGIGDIELSTSDATTPLVRLAHIRQADAVRDTLRGLVEKRRDAKRVRELDLGHEGL
ncbi:MAG: PH domain-containing protein [Lysobacteraceae bacterium]|nr:MAG: PH domain-containing protein [Xanthomonadaceae bacterium]